MSLLAAHINDAGIVVVDASRILYREPGFALLEDDALSTGSAAYSQARMKPRLVHNAYWSDLHAEPLADRRFQHLSPADLVSRQLEEVWRRIGGAGDELAMAVPAYMTTENLGLLLGVAHDLGLSVAALVDAAVAATRREYKGAVPVHVDLSLHSTLLTRIAQAGQAQVDRSEVVDGGLLAIYDAWIRVIAEAFVQQSRFDPLHTAETEQALHDQLPAWLAAAATRDAVPLEVTYRGISHSAEVESLELIAAAAPVYHGIVSSVRALYRADEVPALQLTDRAARMPGLADILKARVGGELFLLEPGATARGLLTRCREQGSGRSAVSLTRHLPWDQAAIEIREQAVLARGGQPTHLLFEHTAHVIGNQPLTLGTQPPDDGERWLDLQRDMPGVSRRHCSLQLENGQCVVRDYSRYGTFLNGHRIDGSAILQVGDHIRLGTPGFELQLITTEVGDGA